jgi:hypothetical protein
VGAALLEREERGVEAGQSIGHRRIVAHRSALPCDCTHNHSGALSVA